MSVAGPAGATAAAVKGRPMTTGHEAGRAGTAYGGAGAGGALAEVGPVSLGAAVGDGPRGLQRLGRRLGYFSHDQARSRAYRWGEDGLAGISDDRQLLCFALALWNGKDPILKERLFGLTNSEGNHGEDVKEYYFYLDSTPTHSYMKYLYKYPQAAYPYGDLVETNRRRGRHGVRVRAARHRRVRPGSLLRRVRRVCQGVAGGPPRSRSPSRTAVRSRRRCTCCRPSGSATRGRGAARRLGRRSGRPLPA